MPGFSEQQFVSRWDVERRHEELREACARARFELIVIGLGADQGLARSESELTGLLAAIVREYQPALVVGPSPHDGHPAHEAVARSIRSMAERGSAPFRWAMWGLWSELPAPNVLVGFDRPRLDEIRTALAAHAGEIERNDFATLAEARSRMNAVLGAERVHGFGSPGVTNPYAELLMDVQYNAHDWELFAPRDFDPEAPLLAVPGCEIGWWLHAQSVRDRLAGERDGRHQPRP